MTPDTPRVREVIWSIVNASASADPMSQVVLATYRQQIASAMVAGGLCLSVANCSVIGTADLRPPVDVRFFASESEIEQLARDEAPLWAAVTFSSVPSMGGAGEWRYSIRFNHSEAARTRRK